MPTASLAPTAQPRRILALLAALAVLCGLLVATTATAQPAAAASRAATEATFVKKLNAERKARGLRPLVVRNDLRNVARSQSAKMSTQNRLHHNPRLANQVKNYRWVGENVGYGPTVAKLHTAFMRSPGHRANVLDRSYTQVGIGTVQKGKRIWVTVVFRQPR